MLKDASTMMKSPTTPAFLVLIALACPPSAVQAAQPLGRFGPAERPHEFVDYGGTPDLRVSPELGLSDVELETILRRIEGDDAEERSRAVSELLSCPPGSEDALRQALYKPTNVSNEALRNAMRDAVRQDKDGDVLRGLLAIGHSESAGTTLRLVTLLRALAAKDTLTAYKGLIDFSPRHAGTLRAEVGRLLVKAGLDALPALLYCRAHPEPETRMFCVRWIRDMGDPLLSEQVLGITNPRRLAQLLEAYCAINDLSAVDVTLSLTNHSSLFVRRAARACIERYGNNAKWGAMRAYENNLGKAPPETAHVQELLNALYTHYDDNRLAKVHTLLDKAREELRRGRLEEMANSYRKALAEAPSFARDEELSAGLVKLTDQYQKQGKREESLFWARLSSWLLEPESADLERLRALQIHSALREAKGKEIVSEAHYRGLLSLDPHMSSARYWLEVNKDEGFQAERALSKSLMVSFILFLTAMLVRSWLLSRSKRE